MARSRSGPQLGPGLLLVAAANLWDDNFIRTVILLCEHHATGSFGLVLNQPTPLKLGDLVTDLSAWDCLVYRGGPVQENTLHFLHRIADLGIDSLEVLPGIYWGGDFSKLKPLLQAGRFQPEDFRFFVGYAGWGKGQLADEMRQQAWYAKPATPAEVFISDSRNHWRKILRGMGEDFVLLADFPDDPRLN
jgi:putative transcriptional regulator